MLNAKYKKIIFSLTAAAVMSMGGVTAFAATSGLIMTPVSSVDVSKIKGQMGEAKIAGTIDSKISDSMKGAKTAPRSGMDSALTLTAVPGSFDTVEGKMGVAKIAGVTDPKILDSMKNAKTAPKSSSELTLTPVYDVDVTKIDAQMVDPSQLEVVREIDPKTVDVQGYITAAR